ncbi:MAG TPA: hypothetical protein VIR02_20505 [Anaerolineales bacterium]
MVTCLRRFTRRVYRLYSVRPGDELHSGYYEFLQVHGGKFPEWIEQQGLSGPEQITARHVGQFL